jgi:hypothetical protein
MGGAEHRCRAMSRPPCDVSTHTLVDVTVRVYQTSRLLTLNTRILCEFVGKGLLWLWLILVAVVPLPLLGQGSAISYQGRLVDGGQPASGDYDLQFALTSGPTEEDYIGATLSISPVHAENGAFTVLLDFGANAFDGSARWLEIRVRSYGSSDPYTLLSPRQPITPAPYALFAAAAGGGSLGGSTNPTVYGGLSLVGTTNVTLYATNNSVVTTSIKTNIITISGAGTPAVNDTYILQTITPHLLFANVSGINLAYLPDDPRFVWKITDATKRLLYGSSAEDVTVTNGWVKVGGLAPAPSAIAYGTDLVTNSLMQLAVAGAAVPGPLLGNELYVNAAIGNDLFAQRGRPDLPYATVYAALQAAGSGDVVRVAPGIYSETPFRLTLPPGVKLIGAGKRVTCIYAHPSTTGEADLDLSTSNVLSSFSTDFVISLGGYNQWSPVYGAASNALLENLEASGVGDVIYCNWWQGLRAFDCDFNSQSDCLADAQLLDSGTNAVAELYNCRLQAGWHGIANFGRGQIRMFGGSIQADISTSSSGACVGAFDSHYPGASIELSGVSLRNSAAAAGATSYAIWNQSSGNCRVTVKGTLVNPANVSGAVSFEGFGLTTNIAILRPGMVTNVLCFTNGLLMDVK